MTRSSDDARIALFLSQISDAERRTFDASDVAVVEAHPDDETVGCGALLAQLEGVKLVVVTDGAPRNLIDAVRYGFPDAASYRERRKVELASSLAVANIPVSNIITFDIPDQEACRRMAITARRLAQVFSAHQTSIVLTHAFEGGHPDHDAVAFSVHAARRLLNGSAPAIVEMPFYHLGDSGMCVQRFCDGRDGLVRFLNNEEQGRKRRMLNCYSTQEQILAPFAIDAERFRCAVEYDFETPPNGGRILYALHDWGLRPSEWPSLAREGRRQLGIGAAEWA